MRIPPETSASRGGLWAVAAAGLSTFAVVTTEMLPVGLMTPIAGALDVPVGQAGLMISIPAMVAAVSAPLVILMAGNIDRRRILSALLILLTLANIASALAQGMAGMLAARGLVGLAMGGIWAIAGGLAPRLVPEAAVGRATAVIFGGVAAASVLGVPLGAVIGEALGWRAAFWAMATFSVMVLGLSLAALPALPVRQSTKVSDFAAQVCHLPVLLGLLLTALLVIGHFTAFTFIRPVLLDHAGFAAEGLGLLLFAYGMAGIFGNFLTGLLVARRLDLVVISIAPGLAVAIAGIALWGHIQGVALMLLILWGLGYGGVSVGLQSWMMRAAPGAVEIATALFVTVFNIAIAAGSGLGGRLVDGQGLQTTLLVAATLPILALFFAIYMTRRA